MALGLAGLSPYRPLIRGAASNPPAWGWNGPWR